MSAGEYYNRPAADWARQNITGRVELKMLFSSLDGRIFIYALLFCVPAAFFVLGLVLLALGAKAKDGVGAAFFFAFLISIPCGVIALLGAYVRRGLAKSLDAEGVSAAMGKRFPWGKLYYVDHVTKHMRVGRVSRQVKDNQLELVFEGGKVTIPPMIRNRAEVWALVNAMPVEVRDDGVPRAAQRSPEQELMAFLN